MPLSHGAARRDMLLARGALSRSFCLCPAAMRSRFHPLALVLAALWRCAAQQAATGVGWTSVVVNGTVADAWLLQPWQATVINASGTPLNLAFLSDFSSVTFNGPGVARVILVAADVACAPPTASLRLQLACRSLHTSSQDVDLTLYGGSAVGGSASTPSAAPAPVQLTHVSVGADALGFSSTDATPWDLLVFTVRGSTYSTPERRSGTLTLPARVCRERTARAAWLTTFSCCHSRRRRRRHRHHRLRRIHPRRHHHHHFPSRQSPPARRQLPLCRRRLPSWLRLPRRRRLHPPHRHHQAHLFHHSQSSRRPAAASWCSMCSHHPGA